MSVLLGILLAAAIAIEPRVETLRSVNYAESKFGLRDRLFVVQDAWELERCQRLLPTFPKINIETEHAVVVMSWRGRKRQIDSIEAEGDGFAVKIAQEPPQPGKWSTTEYVPPDFLVCKIPACAGPVSFLINGTLDHTVLRGAALKARRVQLLADLRVWANGGQWTNEEWLARYRFEYRNDREGEKLDAALAQFRRGYSDRRCKSIVKELAELQDRDALPALAEVAAGLSLHDELAWPVQQAFVALGGGESIGACEDLLANDNPSARGVAMLVLEDLALPSTRALAHGHLADTYDPVARTALFLLYALGEAPEDVHPIVEAIGSLEAQALAGGVECRAKWALAHSLVGRLGKMGPDARDAVPVLKRLSDGPSNCFVDNLRPAADEALAAIQAEASAPSPSAPTPQ
jgi:hypothetical protein